MLEITAQGLLAVTLAAHGISAAFAAVRCRPRAHREPAEPGSPRVTIVRPVCGVEAFDAVTLATTFGLDYPNLHLIFCCDCPNDPAVRLVDSLIQAHPHVSTQLLIGRNPATANPKLNNLLKAWPRIETDWLILADSNVEMPPDYVQRLLACWRPETGAMCAPPIGARAQDKHRSLQIARSG